MKQQPIFFLCLSAAILFISCSNNSGAKLKEPADSLTVHHSSTDTMSNEPQCNISVNGKYYDISAENITTGYTFSDSSLLITFNGVGAGRIVFSIPNLFSIPGKIATGYSSIRFKIAGTKEFSVEPTVTLYDYGKTGISFHNLGDGFRKNEVTPNAAEITSFQKLEENTNTKWAIYLIKGKIHTTVLKNVYESAAGELNRDYDIDGSFVIQTKIYF